MIKLLIADDEEEIRSGIRDIIDWKSNGISVCGEVENGLEALKIIQETAPDILLLDIKMPEMDGIQVMEHLAPESKMKIIILSGYDNFSYAQKALKLGASDYILKPCHKDVILQTVLRVKEGIESELKNKIFFDQLQAQFNHSLPLLKEKYLIKLLNTAYDSELKLLENFELFKINIPTKPIVVAVVNIDYPYHFYEQFTRDAELMKFAIRNICTETIYQRFFHEIIEYNGDIIILVSLDPKQREQLLQLLEQIKDTIKLNLSFSVSIGIGNIEEDIHRIHLSYVEALKSIEAKFFLGADTIIQYQDIHSSVIEDALYPIAEEKSVLNCIAQGNEAELDVAIDGFFTVLSPEKRSKICFTRCCLALYLSIYHFCIERALHEDETLDHNFSTLDSILKLETMSEMKEIIINSAKYAMSRVNRKKGNNKTIEMAVKYIEENYAKDISLENISRSVYLSPSYFSLLFKQVMSINFVDYLNKVRIENACELLKDIQYKTYEIAYKTGFHDEKYFSFIFKKVTGMSPSQFRSNIRL
jgi:two-component system, response regulator YesN